MDHYPYLIIGGGMAAAAAVQGIRTRDVTSQIGIISEENYPPYDRPPLSKGLWTGKSVEELFSTSKENRVALLLEKRAISINCEKHEVEDHLGTRYHFDKLLIATGAKPKKLNLPDQGVIYLRNLDDYYQLRSIYEKGDDFVVIGSGFIGTEIAASLRMNGKNVTLIFPGPSIGHKIYPPSLSNFLNAYYTEQGVRLMPNEGITGVFEEKGRYRIVTRSGQELFADGVVAGIGVQPLLDLARVADLEISDGIVVNEQLQTSHPDIFAAGDNANFFSPLLGKRVRVEHEDNAKHMGSIAGKNMAGAHESYTYHPFFYSDLFQLGYEAIGELSSDMTMVEDWEEDYRRGTVYYLKEGKIRGALLWGIWNQVERIRELIASQRSFEPQELIGMIHVMR